MKQQNFTLKSLDSKNNKTLFFGETCAGSLFQLRDQPDLELTLVKADTEDKLKAVGKQAGDHVFLTLETDDCQRDYHAMKAKGVKFYGEPTEQLRCRSCF